MPLRAVLSLVFVSFFVEAASLDTVNLEAAFASAVKGFNGRVGVCAQDSSGTACADGDGRYSLQSVMKLVTGMAVMDAVEHQGWSLDERLTVHREDLSVYVQPIAKLVTDAGYTTTVGDLVRRAIVDSDSAAVDILIRKLGGARKVQEFLDRKGIRGVRVDRQERDLQTETDGLRWKPEYVDPAALERDIKALPKSRRDAANRKYQSDPRDTATPRGMTALLQSLAEGKLLSRESSSHLIDVMTQTVTFPDRLKAGVPAGWTIAHKTGTSGDWNGVTVATNDVGILRAPGGAYVSITVFIGDSRAPAAAKASLMAKLAALTAQNYR